jgi:hypothetical protein
MNIHHQRGNVCPKTDKRYSLFRRKYNEKQSIYVLKSRNIDGLMSNPCVQCKYATIIDQQYKCKLAIDKIDNVTGSVHFINANIMRSQNNPCGPEGNLFKIRSNIIYAFKFEIIKIKELTPLLFTSIVCILFYLLLLFVIIQVHFDSMFVHIPTIM